ncbi:MAG: hypothetical protein JWO78_468 [Micavibrio sp.]|nr:hypothetical protein [Micavibrio sp.]
MAEKSGIWFVYDGECPLCNSAAQAFRIKEDFGVLHLINARESAGSAIMDDVTSRGLNLDEGMVILVDGHAYHGKDALKFMARYGEAQNSLTLLCKTLLRSDKISSLAYPALRGMRNLLLRRKGIGPINNLKR